MKRPRRDEIWLVALDPVMGAEIQKTRPCVVISPDDLNDELLTVIVAPMTSTIRPFPFRVSLTFQGKAGQIALDQSRAVSLTRMVRKLGTVSSRAALEASATLCEMFRREGAMFNARSTNVCVSGCLVLEAEWHWSSDPVCGRADLPQRSFARAFWSANR